MKELENKKELMEAEEEKVAGGKISPICLGEKGWNKNPKNRVTAAQPAAGKENKITESGSMSGNRSILQTVIEKRSQSL